jgi:hypothetical protein
MPEAWALGDHDLTHVVVCFYIFVSILFYSETPSCRPTLQTIQPIHLNALNTTILHLNILH